MRKISVVLIIVGIVLIIAGSFFYKTQSDAVESRPITVTLSGNKSFQWPVYTGIIVLFLGAVFNVASRRNTKADHTTI